MDTPKKEVFYPSDAGSQQLKTALSTTKTCTGYPADQQKTEKPKDENPYNSH